MADTLRADILQKPDNTKLYHKIYSTWPRGPYVRLHIGNYPELFRLPQAFLEGCGQNSLRFVQELVQYCVQEPGHLSNLAQLGLELDDAPPPGQTLEFAAVEADTTFTWMPGPDGRYRGRAPAQDEAFDDTASLRPSEVSEMQNILRWRIVARDTACIVSGDGLEDSQAAHLAPKHREDIYTEALGDEFESPAYKTPYAVLLETKLHRRYDRFQWSFYPRISFSTYLKAIPTYDRIMVKRSPRTVFIYLHATISKRRTGG
ncbi:MAG: hypothetical protein CYPHOPRED_003850 [Cyphobasidiales sp. Tagirdzhanova-0007]|nr:MAG: hypothetical protein CYPHOPRED_003850 [Cyphobasidiales sp. Tagirdzhanova-0007]